MVLAVRLVHFPIPQLLVPKSIIFL